MYRRFISFFRYRDATRALRGSSGILGPKLWTLDAGAGSELQPFALWMRSVTAGANLKPWGRSTSLPQCWSGSIASWIREASGRFVSNKQTSWSSISNCLVQE